jgi:hypothetical protein
LDADAEGGGSVGDAGAGRTVTTSRDGLFDAGGAFACNTVGVFNANGSRLVDEVVGSDETAVSDADGFVLGGDRTEEEGNGAVDRTKNC